MKSLILVILCAVGAWGQSPGPKDSVWSATIPGSCGEVLRYASNKISPECYTAALNVLFDEDNTVLRRKGQAKYNATGCGALKTIRGLWPFTDTSNNKYLVILSSETMYQTSGQGDCVAISGLTDFNTAVDMNCVQTIGKLWCTNGSNSVFYWDGSSTATVSGAPLGKLIGAFRNRVVLADISGQRTRIRLSGELDGTDWTVTIPGRSTTPANIDIAGLNDGLEVQCLLGEYQNAFFIGRDRELYALSGYDRRDFTLRKISSEIGCIEQKSIQEKNNSLYWLSRRGIEKLSGTQISRASDNIRPLVDNIIETSANLRTKLFTTQSDWQSGNLAASGAGSPISATISINNVVASTWTNTDTSSANFASGSSTYIDLTGETGKVKLSSNVFEDNFARGDYASSPATWTVTYGDWEVEDYFGDGTKWIHSGGIAQQNIIYSSSTVAYGSFKFDHFKYNSYATDEFFYRFIYVDSSNYYTLYMSNVGPTILKLIKTYGGVETILTAANVSYIGLQTKHSYEIIRSTDGTFYLYQDSVFISSATDNTLTTSNYIYISAYGNRTATIGYNYFTNIYNYVYQSSGTLNSRIFDTSFSTPIGGPFVSTFTVVPGEAQISFWVRSSTSPNNDMWTAVQATSDTLRVNLNKRYWQYITQLNTHISTKTPTIEDVTLQAETSGYYITNCATTTSISSWGLFRTNYQLNSGQLTFAVSTGPTCHSVTRTTANWVTQNANANISIDTSTYIASRVLFNMDSATQTPTLNDITFEWNSGASRTPTASAVYRDRYLLFYTSSTDSSAHNDHVLVLDSTDKWAEWDGINAYSAALYNNKLYTGSSQNDGYVYLQDVGTNDDGSSFTFKIKTPDLDFGNPSQRKIFKTLYVDLAGPAIVTQSINVSASYNVDGSTTSYSLSAANLNEADEQSAYFTAKFPFPKSQKVDGHWLAITLQYTGADGPLRIYGMRLIHEGIDWK